MATIGRNISFPIYNGDGTSFHNLVIKKATYDSIVMSLGDKITGDVYYKDNNLVTNQDIYIVYNGVHYTLVNPPTIVREGMTSENGELKGMTKYSFEFYHPMYQLNNFPFSDIAVTSSQGKYLSQNKTFAWIGDLYDYVDKINVNLDGTVWCCEIGSSVQEVDKAKLSDVLSFNNQTIADALKTGYETWEIPYVISQLPSTDTRYSRDGKRFLITFGLPSTEIIGANKQPYVFRFGQGVGLKNNSRTPRNNKIVTRLAGYGSENNIPWGYPQIIWTGNESWNYTIDNDPTDPNSYPIYDGIVNGERVRLIKHPFTRNHLMPSIYAETVNRKVNPNAIGYDPDTVIIDYYDADDEDEFENIINPDAPSYEIHEFEDIKPELGEQYLVDVSAYDANAITLSECESMVLDYYSESNIEAEKTQLLALYNALPNTASGSGSSGVYKYDWSIANDGDYLLVKYKSSGVNFEHKVTRQVTPDWDDSIDDDGNYKQSYFKVTLPELGFDLYACAALTEKMQINMRSGDCIGCTFDVMIDWDDYKKNFYTEDGKFDPVIGTGHPRNGTKYPDSTNDEITLIVQKDNNTFGIIMPNIYQQPTSRDKFVILGISLPLAYITDAEERLDADMIQYMKDNNVFYFDYPLKFDEDFLYRNTSILAQMKPNVIVRFEYAGVVNALYIKQMSIKYGQGVLPQYDITLTDDVEIVLNKIGQVTDEVSKLRLMMGEGGDANVAELDKRYLSKRNDDTAEGMISMTKGLYVGNNFVTGLLGEGGVMRMDNDGTTYLEVDKMYVRMRAYFDTVEVRRFLHSGGNRIASLAGMKCTRVEYINSSGNVTKDASSAVKFRCYFRANDDGNVVTNDFIVGDLAFCKETNAKVGTGVEQHGYWRAVVGVSEQPNSKGEHYIDLSASDCLSGSDIPIAQDDIIQLGNNTDTTRQGAIIEYVGGDDAPAYQIYQGINTYSLNDKNYVRFGYDSQSGGAQAYIGNPDGSTYLWYHNVTEGGVPIQRLDIKANVIFQSPTTHQDTTIENFATIVTNDIDNIQAQIDGQIESWFYDYMPVQETSGAPANRIPLTNKEPYKTWYEEDNGGTASEVTTERTKHLGDTFYDNSSGYAFRFSLNTTVTPNVFEWVVIEDSAVIKALEDAANAQDTADHKRRVFLSTPTTPYDAGDLWAQGENGDLFMCTTSRQSGNYVASDWELATKYTDDTKYNSFITRLLNGMPSGSDETSVTNALNAIKGAYNQGTEVHGGLVLTSLIGLLDSNGDTQAGISGQYSSTAFGNGLAFWAGGGMIDKRNSSTGAYDVADGAKIGLRFDGSGYVANGNLFWNANGDVNIQGYSINATTLKVGGVNVATESTISTFFANFFDIYNGNTQITYAQYIALQNKSNVSIKAKYGLWTEQYLSALGQNSQGGGGTGSFEWQMLTEYDGDASHKINNNYLNDNVITTVNQTSTTGYVSSVSVGTNHTLNVTRTAFPTASSSTLGMVKVGNKLSISDGVLNLKSSYVSSLTYSSKKFAKATDGGTASDLVSASTIVADGGGIKAIKINGTPQTVTSNSVDLPAYPDISDLAKKDGSNATGTWGISISGNAASSTGLVSTTMPSGANYDDYMAFPNCRVYDNADSLDNIQNIGKYSTLVSMGKYLRTFQIRADHYSTFLAYRVLQDNGEGSPQRFVFTDWRNILHSDAATLNNNVTLRWKDNGGTDLNCLNLSANNELGIGYETSSQGYSTYIDGAAIYLRYGAGHATGLSIAGSGAVTIANVLSANGGIVVPASKSIKIGTIVLEDDNGLLKVWDGTGNAVKGIYATGTVSALGANTSGGGGTGIEMPQVWEALAQAGSGEPINITHLQAALTSNGYMHSFSKTSPAGANVVTDVNYNSSTGTLSVTRGSLAMNALAPRDIPSSLATFYDGDNLIYTRAGGSNTVADKPSGVTAFGVITMRTAVGYYGQILYSTADGHIYYRNAATSSLEGTAWNTLLGTLNYKSYTYDKTQTYNKNMVLASSATADGNAATFRALVANDIPNLNASKITAGTLDAARLPDLSGTYVPTSTKWWGQSISNGAVSGAMTGVGSITPVTNSSSRPNIGTRDNYFGDVYGVSLTLADTTSNEDMYFGWRDVTINDVSERVFTMYAYQTRYSDILLGQSGVSPGGGIFYDVSENRVGIGTYTPQRTLDIAGTLGVSGRLYANGKITVTHEGGTGTGNELIVLSVGGNATYNCISYEKSSGWTNGYNWSSGINADGYYLWNAANGGTQQLLVTNNGQTQVKSLKIGTITLTDDNGLLKIDKGVYSTGTVSALGANSSSSGGGGADIADVWDALARPDSSKLIDSSHINITTSGSGNAVTAVTKSGTSITLNKGISFLPLTGNNATNTPVTGDVIFDNGISLKWKKSSGSTAYSVLCLDGSNQLMLGLATARKSCDTKIYGNNIYLNYGVSGTTGITLASGGNVTIANNLTVSGNNGITAKKFVKSGGTATQFLKADGSVDGNTYATTSSLGDYVTKTETDEIIGTKTFTGNGNVRINRSGNYIPYIWFKNGNGTLGGIGTASSAVDSGLGRLSANGSNVYKLWDSGNDGADSGLDADLLDGNHGHWYMKRGAVYTSGVSGTRWMKVASLEMSTAFNTSHYSEIILIAHDYTSQKQVGILALSYGREGSATSPRTPYIYAKWIIKTADIDITRFVLAYDFTYTETTATSKAYLYVKMTGVWQQYYFAKLSEAGWNVNTNLWVLNTGDTTSAYNYTTIPETNQIVSTDISYASNAGMLNGVAASGYVTIAGTQKITGVKTFDVDKLEVLGGQVEENVDKSTIKFKTFANNTYYMYDNSGVVNTSSAIRNSILFDWYDTAWVIGNIRGAGTDSYGFGFGCRFSNNGNVLDRFHITTMGDAYIATSLYAGSEVTASSDERLKTINGDTSLTIKDIADAPAIKFLWKDKRDEKVHIGSIAQYWEKALPEAVSYGEKGIMSLNYGALALVSAITIARDLMKHENEITKLKKRVAELENELKERRAA